METTDKRQKDGQTKAHCDTKFSKKAKTTQFIQWDALDGDWEVAVLYYSPFCHVLCTVNYYIQ